MGHCRIDRSSGRLRREGGLLKISLALSVTEPCVLLSAYSLRRNWANKTGGAKSNMGIRSQVRKRGELFESALNIHTPLPPLSPQLFYFAPVQLSKYKKNNLS